MKTSNIKLLAAISLPFLQLWPVGCSVQPAQADGFAWLHDYQQALKQSQEQSKLIFAYLETDWCTYCREMEKTTLQDRKLIEDMGGDFIWLKLNAEKDEDGIRLRDRFRIDSFPGMLILTSQGEEIDRITGYLSSEGFRRQVPWLAKGPMAVKRLLESLKKNPDDAELNFQLAERRRAREEFSLAAESYSRYLELDPKNSLEMRDHALYYHAAMLSMTGKVDQSLTELLQLEKEYPESRYLPDTILLKGQIYQSKGVNSQARAAFQTYLDEYPNHGYADRVRDILARMPQDMPLVRSH